MTDALRKVREASRTREQSLKDWETAIVAAVRCHSLAEVSRVAGVTRQRVWQITRNHR